eukprot:scaffold163631_cov31-Attheya_sp.AAC.1
MLRLRMYWVTYLRLFVKACAVVTLAQRERCLGNFLFQSHIAPPYVGRLTCNLFRKHVPSSPLLKESGVSGLSSAVINCAQNERFYDLKLSGVSGLFKLKLNLAGISALILLQFQCETCNERKKCLRIRPKLRIFRFCSLLC